MAHIEQRKGGWRVQIRRKGARSISRTFDLKADAEAWGREAERELQRGNLTVLRQEAQRTTLSEVIDAYLASPRLAAQRSRHNIPVRLEAARARFGKLFLANIRGLDIAAWRDDLLAQGYASQSARHYLAALSVVFTHAERELGIDLPQGNPVRRLALPAAAPARDRRLRPGEEDALRAAAENADQIAILTLALETSMRRGEMLGLGWEHIDLKRRTAHLPRTKNGESRTVALSSKAVDALQSLPRRLDGPVFRWKTAEGFKAVWTRWLARARRTVLLNKLRTELDSIGLDGEAQARALQWHKREPDPRAAALWDRLQSDPFLDDLHFHDLRHEATSRLFEKGLGIMEVASMTGHKSLSMLKRYTHIEAEKLAKKLG